MPISKIKSKVKRSGKKKKTTSTNEGYEVVSQLTAVPTPREKLVELLKTRPVHERDLYGIRVSTKALEKLTSQEIQDLRFVFDAMDIQQKGYLSAVEVRKAMNALGFKIKKDETNQLTGAYSRNMIKFNEFLSLVIDHQSDSRDTYEEIISGFNLMHLDESGKISLKSLKSTGQHCGLKLTNNELKEMLEEADVNGDGFVDEDEFIKIMLQTNLF